jgi:hypothetical protein
MTLSLQTTNVVVLGSPYDDNKKRNGFKRFVLCDSKGHIQSIFCARANSYEKKTLNHIC